MHMLANRYWSKMLEGHSPKLKRKVLEWSVLYSKLLVRWIYILRLFWEVIHSLSCIDSMIFMAMLIQSTLLSLCFEVLVMIVNIFIFKKEFASADSRELLISQSLTTWWDFSATNSKLLSSSVSPCCQFQSFLYLTIPIHHLSVTV